mmetsp:Transcript_2180/g.3764  ORF Transcript_2180/g.3764 Transcript_2180/m.3764 type:complete len:147 (-) Transcript_2180:79-519(-)
MPPRNFSFGSGDCESSFFDSLLSTSIHSFCTTETRPRVASPSYPMCGDVANECAKNDTASESGQQASSSTQVSKDNNTATPVRPRLPKGSTQRRRKLPGLSVIIPESPADVHATPPTCPVSLRRNVELKKKLSQTQFLFRPISDED